MLTFASNDTDLQRREADESRRLAAEAMQRANALHELYQGAEKKAEVKVGLFIFTFRAFPLCLISFIFSFFIHSGPVVCQFTATADCERRLLLAGHFSVQPCPRPWTQHLLQQCPIQCCRICAQGRCGKRCADGPRGQPRQQPCVLSFTGARSDKHPSGERC